MLCNRYSVKKNSLLCSKSSWTHKFLSFRNFCSDSIRVENWLKFWRQNELTSAFWRRRRTFVERWFVCDGVRPTQSHNSFFLSASMEFFVLFVSAESESYGNLNIHAITENCVRKLSRMIRRISELVIRKRRWLQVSEAVSDLEWKWYMKKSSKTWNFKGISTQKFLENICATAEKRISRFF